MDVKETKTKVKETKEVKENLKNTKEIKPKETKDVKNNTTTEPVKSEETIKIEKGINKMVNETIDDAVGSILDVKKQESELMNKINETPENSQKLIETEIEKVEQAIKKVTDKIENLSKQVNNKGFMKCNEWNGWGYDM